MDFGATPPEINSGRMYAGPGSAPLLAAASAWRALAADLELVAAAYGSVLTEVGTAWAGPSASAMAAAATPYVSWLHGAAAVAEQTAVQTFAAATAYEAAFTMTVPPPAIAANRSLLAALIATNFVGQNLPAIAATEAAYAAMWAQDAAAMYTYAATAALVTVLPAPTPPPKVTDPGGAIEQVAAAGDAAANSSQQALTSALLQAVTSPTAKSAASGAPSGGIGGLLAELPASTAIELLLIPIHLAVGLFGGVVIDGLGVVAIDLPGAVGSMLVKDLAVAAGPYVLAGASAPAATAASAGIGQAIPLSGLSVPTSWTTAAGGAAKPPAGERPAVAAPVPRASADQLAMAGTAGLASAAGMGGERDRKPAAAARRIAAAPPPREPVVDLGAQIRELLALHADGLLTDEEYAVEKHRLLQ